MEHYYRNKLIRHMLRSNGWILFRGFRFNMNNRSHRKLLVELLQGGQS